MGGRGEKQKSRGVRGPSDDDLARGGREDLRRNRPQWSIAFRGGEKGGGGSREKIRNKSPGAGGGRDSINRGCGGAVLQGQGTRRTPQKKADESKKSDLT